MKRLAEAHWNVDTGQGTPLLKAYEERRDLFARVAISWLELRGYVQ